MNDAYDQNETDVGISLDTIEDEIRKGLPSHAGRLARAYVNEEFFAGRNAAWVKRRSSEEWVDRVTRPIRTSKLTRKVCRVLSEHLYSPGPMRNFTGMPNGVKAWLNSVYEANHINALMQKADQKTVLNSTCAIQVCCGGRVEKPVSLYLWGAHEYAPFMYPTDPTVPWAVVTIQRNHRYEAGQSEERLRFEAWSRDEHRVYVTKWQVCMRYDQFFPDQIYQGLFGNPAMPVQGESGIPAGSGKNPYGCLPFQFIHDELPVCSFWEGGIGNSLVECNLELDREMSDLAQVVKAHMAPDGFLRNVSPSWRREKRPGSWQLLTPGKNGEADAAPEQPDAFFVQPDLKVQEIWLNIKNFADSTLEELDVPLTVVRDDLSTEIAGVSLEIKLRPLTSRTKARQGPFASYEKGLASMVLLASGNYYKGTAEDENNPDVAVSAEALLAAAGVPEPVELLWPEAMFSTPSAERDQQDDWEMATSQKSLIDVVSQRCGSTRDVAIERIKQVVKDNELLATILPPPPAPEVDPGTEPTKEPIGKNKPQPAQQQQPSANGNGTH